MAFEDTSAGRLHEIFRRLQRHANQPLRQTWATEFGVDVEDRAGILTGIATVLALPGTVEQEVRALHNQNHELLMRWEPAVSAAFSIAHQLEQSTGQLAGQVNTTTLLSLETVADVLERNGQATYMERDAIDEANAKVVELLDALGGLDASDEIKAMLIRHAVRLQAALRLYNVTGAEGVREALVDAAAAVAAARTGPDDKRSGVRKFVDLIAFVSDSLQIVASTALVTPGVSEIIHQITKH